MCKNCYQKNTTKCCPNSLNCKRKSVQTGFPTNYIFGYCYVPNQMINETFTPPAGLCRGTIFPELVSPYEPDDSIKFINYLKQGGKKDECN